MIYEFALDPTLVATWHDRLEYLYFEEKFGVQTRRIVSIYPKDWERLVWSNVENDKIGHLAKKKLEVILLDVLKGTIKRASTFPGVPNWLERAEMEHDQRPFRTILSTNNPRSNPSVIDSCTLIETGHDLWNIPELTTTPRTPEGMAEALKPVLQFCKKVVFVEPYFSVKHELINTLKRLFGIIWECRIPGSDPVVQIQAKLDDGANEAEGVSFISGCEHGLSRIIPSGKRVQLTVKKNRPGQQRFHNRYILTDTLGIGLPSGLTDTSPYKTETDDLYIMERPQYIERWMQYVNGSPSPFEVLAQKTITGV